MLYLEYIFLSIFFIVFIIFLILFIKYYIKYKDVKTKYEKENKVFLNYKMKQLLLNSLYNEYKQGKNPFTVLRDISFILELSTQEEENVKEKKN